MVFEFELPITGLDYLQPISRESLNVSIAQMHHVFAPMEKELDSDFRLLMQLCVLMLAR
jgi:hypothetical protein